MNGIRLHYVVGGEGSPIVLLPGWPETWWAYHKIMPELARHHRVMAVALRSMGRSDRPADGYDKRTMAREIAELIRQFGHEWVDVVGHDIGSMVAFSMAANHAELVRRLVMMDVPHPDAALPTWALLPPVGTFGDKVEEGHSYP